MEVNTNDEVASSTNTRRLPNQKILLRLAILVSIVFTCVFVQIFFNILPTELKNENYLLRFLTSNSGILPSILAVKSNYTI